MSCKTLIRVWLSAEKLMTVRALLSVEPFLIVFDYFKMLLKPFRTVVLRSPKYIPFQ